MAGRNSRRAPGNARNMSVKDKPTSSRRRAPANAEKMTVDKARAMEASKSGKGTVSAKDKKTLRNASVRESTPTKNKYAKSKEVATQTKSSPVKKKPSNVSTEVQSKKLPATTKGRAVTKTSPKRGVKNMGKANVVPKKAIGVAKNATGVAKNATGVAKKAAKSTPFGVLVAGVVGNSMERSSYLIEKGKIKTPMDMVRDKTIYGDRLTKTKTTQMPLPKSKPLLSAAGNAKAVKDINPKAGEMAGKVVKPTVTAPQKAVTKTSAPKPTKTTKPAKKTATSNYKPQDAIGTQMTKKRMDSGYKNPAKAPKPSTPKPKKPVNSSLEWLMEADW